MKSPIKVAVTGPAGQIGYALLPRIASGAMFGPDQPVILQLIEVPVEKAMLALEGVAMELDDCAFPLLQGMVLTDDPNVGFADANWCLLVGAKPRGPGMERADLLKDNGKIFTTQGSIIDAVAAENARVAVVGNPANTNCMIAASKARRLTPDRFTAMVRLDQNRAQSQLAKKAGVATTDVKDIFIYGNHSPTSSHPSGTPQFPANPQPKSSPTGPGWKVPSAKPSASAAQPSSPHAGRRPPRPPPVHLSITSATSRRRALSIPSPSNPKAATVSTPKSGPECQ